MNQLEVLPHDRKTDTDLLRPELVFKLRLSLMQSAEFVDLVLIFFAHIDVFRRGLIFFR